MRWPKRGVKVCPRHGGHAPQVIAAGERRLAAEQARRDVDRFGGSREVDPSQALLEEVHRSAGTVEFLRQRVNALAEADLVWGVVEEVDKPITDNGGGLEVRRRAQPSVWVTLYQQERKHLAAVSKAAIDAGVDQRLVAVFEQVGASFVQVIEHVLDELELTEVQRARVPGVVQAQLQALAGGAS